MFSVIGPHEDELELQIVRGLNPVKFVWSAEARAQAVM